LIIVIEEDGEDYGNEIVVSNIGLTRRGKNWMGSQSIFSEIFGRREIGSRKLST